MRTTCTQALAVIFGVFISSFVIISCQKGGLLNTESTNEGASNSSTRSTILNSDPSLSLPDCGTYCISPEGPYVEQSNSKTQTYGNGQHSKTVSYVAYNTASSFVVKVTYQNSQGSTSDAVTVTAFGIPKSIPNLANDATNTFTFDLPSGWTKCYNVTFSIRQEGQSSPIEIGDTYSLYGVCVGCITEFSGEAISCGTQREAVYHFVSKDAISDLKIQGGLTNFTGADAIVEVSDPSLSVSQWTPGGSSNRIIKVEGGVQACQVLTIRIKWNSSNTGGIITGSWAATDGSGVELVSPVSGLSCGN